jgi:multidrug efflux pump subunit AcrA (membrane-fusion protein)
LKVTVPRAQRVKKWILLCLAAAAIAEFAAVFLLRPAPAAYDSVQARLGGITTYYTFSGNVRAKKRQTVVSGRMMQIADVHVSEGDRVAEGDALLTSTDGETIAAKISGEVSEIRVESGDQVISGKTLMQIIDSSRLEIRVNVDEYDLPALKVGDTADVIISATGKRLTGAIAGISSEGIRAGEVTYFTATITVENDNTVKSGMSAEVRVVHRAAQNVVVLPMAALRFDADNTPYVLLAGKNGAPVKTRVTVGINDGNMAEIKKGLLPGAVVCYPAQSGESKAADVLGLRDYIPE